MGTRFSAGGGRWGQLHRLGTARHGGCDWDEPFILAETLGEP